MGMESMIRDIGAPPPELQGLIGGQPMAEPACKCTSELCGHPKGAPCGKPIENPLPMRVQLNANGPAFSPEFPYGLCEECLKTRGAYGTSV